MIIAIDGPAASGKGTLGKRLAKHYGYRHLDTGVIYRAVAKALLDAGADLTNEMLAVSAALELDPEKFGNPALKTQEVGDAASVVSAIPKVREVLVNFQRQFAADPPGAVLDGRDIGTVICPHADVKIFVVADPKVRARRGFEPLPSLEESPLQVLNVDIPRSFASFRFRTTKSSTYRTCRHAAGPLSRFLPRGGR